VEKHRLLHAVFSAGLTGVPQDLLDAATIDGAGAWRRFRNVTLPMLGPTFAFVVPIAVLNALTQVDQVVIMTQGGPADATNLLLYYIYQQEAQNYDVGLASAATMISVAALLACRSRHFTWLSAASIMKVEGPIQKCCAEPVPSPPLRGEREGPSAAALGG
jgi:ABC-type sugar transport system permease subunit